MVPPQHIRHLANDDPEDGSFWRFYWLLGLGFPVLIKQFIKTTDVKCSEGQRIRPSHIGWGHTVLMILFSEEEKRWDGKWIIQIVGREIYLVVLTSVRPVSPLLPPTIPTEIEFFACCLFVCFYSFSCFCRVAGNNTNGKPKKIAHCLSHVFTQYTISW